MSDINPNSDKEHIDNIDLLNVRNFPKFLKAVNFHPFRHIPDLNVEFKHPISVIAGTNRSGKSTILMALACSHLKFNKQDITNGKIRRHTWSDLMLFTNHDKQNEDWNYSISYKLGDKNVTKKGYRKHTTKKWGGIGKKEGQFDKIDVVFVDMDRILPARNFSKEILRRAKEGLLSDISENNQETISKHISYILEESFQLKKVVHHTNKDIFKYTNSNEYSSYNTASGEDVLLKIIIDIVEAEENSLILIDEIEIGLHPKVQKRLMQVIYNIARNDSKQFIITTHSPSILSSVPDKARIFIEKQHNSNFKVISSISINAALSKMDSESYPLVDIFCEDDTACLIIKKAISDIERAGEKNFANLINVIKMGSADKTYYCFMIHKETYDKKKIKTGYACILDGDMRCLKKHNSQDLQYPPEDCLHFIYSDFAPEKFLVDEYVKANRNTTLEYHIKNSDAHCLFDKMVENSLATNKQEAFEMCWDHFITTDDGQNYLKELKNFIINVITYF
jgi:predicted ATPase